MSEAFHTVVRLAQRLKHTPGVDVYRLCYFVDDREWQSIADYMATFSNVLPGEPLPTTQINILGLEVKRRT